MSTDPGSLDTSVSPAVDPANADAVSGELIAGAGGDGKPIHHPVFGAGRNVLATLHTISLSLAGVERDIKAAGLKDPQTEARLRRAASSKMGGAMKTVEQGLQSIGDHRAKVADDIDAALLIPQTRTGVVESMRSGDVRAHLRSLGSPTERVKAIHAAIGDGDAEAVAAVLSASPLASGLSPKDIELIRTLAETKFAPTLVRTRAAIDKLRAIVERGAKATEQRFGGLTGVGSAKVAKAERALAALEGGAA